MANKPSRATRQSAEVNRFTSPATRLEGRVAAVRASGALEITEKVWQKQLEGLAKTLGYTHVYHTFLSRWSDAGFPDLVLVHPLQKRVVYVECKRETGKLTEKQAQWIEALQAAGAEVYVWRPSDWDTAVETLRRQERSDSK